MGKTAKEIWLLCANDFHAELEESEGFPGCAKFVAAVQRFKAAHPNSIMLFGGDNYKGDPVSEFLGGEPVTQMMRLLDTKASVLGNHEFDAGMEVIRGWQQQGGYRFLAANLRDQRTGRRPADIGADMLLEVDGIRVLLVGLAMREELATVDRPPEMQHYEILDGCEVAKGLIGQAAEGAERPNAVVALTHFPLVYKNGTGEPVGEEALRLCETVPEVDGLFTGHLHKFMALYSNGVAVAQGCSSSKGFAWIHLEFDEAGTLLAATPGYEDIREYAAELESDPAMEAIHAGCKARAMASLGRVVTHLDERIIHRDTDFEVDPEGTPLSELATRVMRCMTGCEVALFYAGRIGRGLPAGEVTLYALYQTLFFNNGIVTMRLCGREILDNIEIGIRRLKNESASPIAVGGLRVEADYALPYLQRVKSITMEDGTPLDMDKHYTVAVDDYLAGDPMGFRFFAGQDICYTGLSVRTGMIEALEQGYALTGQFEKNLVLRNKDG